MGQEQHQRPLRQVSRLLVIGSAFALVVILLMMWLGGAFHQKMSGPVKIPGPRATLAHSVDGATLVTVRSIRVPRTESAVGSIETQHEAAVASKILAAVVEVKVKAGQRVSKGDVLVRLDETDLDARLGQATAAAKAARARRDQAKIEFDRIKKLFEQGSAAKIEFDRVRTANETAKADLKRAEQAVTEAATVVGYATITSPIDGIVIDKRVEAGDTVTPGQVLVNLYDPTRMQLIARVRESLTHRLSVGQMIGVRIDSLGKTCQGRVSEIVPEAQSSSRTFSVKVTGPCPPGVYSGMFGRIFIPLNEEKVLVVPKKAVQHVGQLRLVYVKDGQNLRRRAVKLGRSLGDDIEVLAGLREGEQVAAHPPAGPAKDA